MYLEVQIWLVQEVRAMYYSLVPISAMGITSSLVLISDSNLHTKFRMTRQLVIILHDSFDTNNSILFNMVYTYC